MRVDMMPYGTIFWDTYGDLWILGCEDGDAVGNYRADRYRDGHHSTFAGCADLRVADGEARRLAEGGE